jgi:ATP-dependent helicase/nuclease subunit A
MTRARDRLVIAPFTSARKESPAEAWCEMVRLSLVQGVQGLVLEEAPYGSVHVWREGEGAGEAEALEAHALPVVERPAWLAEPVPPEPEPLPPIRPSGALAAADRGPRPGDGPFAPDARLRGTLVHALLERLPAVDPDRRPDLARAYVAARAPRWGEDQRARVVRDALSVLGDERLAALFGPGSRAEAPIAGRILTLEGADLPVSGQIDRLAILPHAVLVADFKTTARPPDPDAPVPLRHAAQLALYCALMREIVPDRPVRAFLVWTSGPLVRELDEGELRAALAHIKAA